jgi:hypothetical protein
MKANAAEAMPLPCGPYLQALLVKAAEALDYSEIPSWDTEGQRNLHGIRQGIWQPYWTARQGRRHLSRTDAMACAALESLAAAANGPAWADTEASDAQRLAVAIREGRCAVW